MAPTKAFFLSGSEYLRYDIGASAVDPGYPKAIAAGWTGSGDIGFGDGIDACLDPGGGRIYFFQGAQYIAVDAASNSVLPGYPLSTADSWAGMGGAGFDTGLEAAAVLDDGRALFFKGGLYVTYDAKPGGTNQVTAGPGSVAADFPGLADIGFDTGLDAVLAWPNGKLFFFKGGSYVRFDIPGWVVDAEVRSIADGWSLGAFDAGLSAAYVKLSAAASGGGQAGDASDLSDAFFVAVKSVAAAIGATPEDLLGVMMSESGVHPWAQNPHGHATGLIQFMPDILQGLGWTAGPDAFKALSAEAQMPYVQKFFSPWKQHGLGSAGRLYQATFLPGTLKNGSDEGTVICGVNGPLDWAYKANPGLDMNKDGQITVGDLTARVAAVQLGARWTDIVNRLNAV